MRLIFVTQTLDADHPVLAHTLDLVGALALRFDEVVVLCGSAGGHDLPPNVRVRVFGAPTRLRRGTRFARSLVAELARRPRADALFAHMVPLFAVLAAPVAKPLRVPLLLWYTQWHASRTLGVAARLVDVILSAQTTSFPLRSDKVQGIGHAIDVERFSPGGTASDGPLHLLALGRYAPVKGYDTLLAGFRLALEDGLDARLEVRGPTLTDTDRAHRAALEATVRDTPVFGGRVELGGPLPHADVPAVFRRIDALVSTTQPQRSETFDKVLCEAGASGVPVVASNRALEGFLGGLPLDLRFPPGDAAALAAVLGELAAADPETRAEIAAELRRRVVAGHSVDSWADAVTAIVAGERRQ